MSDELFLLLFSPQKKASLQQEITGHLSHRELEVKLSEMEKAIKGAKGEQEVYQKDIDRLKQSLQDTSQEQDKGRTHVYWHQSCLKNMCKIVLLIIVTSLIVSYCRHSNHVLL